jgi:DNA-binding SARP family transcriptional activator
VIGIRLLGRFAVNQAGQEIAPSAFGGRLARRLLRLLALQRGVLVPKEMIADALWPEVPPADPAGNIEVLVSRIRHALGDRALIRTAQAGYVLADDARCWVDAEAFLAAVQAGRAALTVRPAQALASFRAALSTWSGEPLPEDTYADWAQADRRRLLMCYLDALDGAAAAALAGIDATTDVAVGAGIAGEAADWARRAMAAEPLRESSALLLVRALAAAGGQAAALSAFAEYTDRLAVETGLQPTQHARAVCQRILAGGTATGGTASSQPEPRAAGCRHAAGSPLAGLPSRSRDMLGLLALLGRPAPPALLAAAANTDLRSVLDILEGLDSAGLASVSPQGWTPCQDGTGIRQVVTAAMRPADQARCHALLAVALRQRGADPAEVAAHLAASGDPDGAAVAYADAARHQLDRIRDREAARLAEAGLSLDPQGAARAALLEVRGEAHRRRGGLAAARADFSATLDCHDDPAARSRVLAQLAILDARTIDAARGGELAELAIAEAGSRPAALGQALAAAAIIDLTEGNLARARYRARRAARLLDLAGDRVGCARLLYWRAMSSFVEGRLRDAADQLGRLACLPATAQELLPLWNPRTTRGHVLVLLGKAAAGLAEIDASLASARSARHRAIEAECLGRRAEALAAIGRLAEAIEAAEQAAGIAARIGHAEWTAASHRGLGIACEAAGLTDRAETAYQRSLEAAAGLPLFHAWAAARLGALLARQGRPGEAAPHIRVALAGRMPLTRHEARWAHAELLASRGDRQGSSGAAAAALDRAQADGYLIVVPRLRELADCKEAIAKEADSVDTDCKETASRRR